MDKYQVVIVGGGIAGVGIAKACNEKGLKTLIIEKNELGKSTSNNSLRIMHAGFRYFQKFDFPRIIDSIKAESELRREFPELIKELKCLMPINSFGVKSKIPLTLVAFVYYNLSKLLVKNYNPSAKIITESEVPNFYKSYVNKNAFLWHDSLLLNNLELIKKIIKEFKDDIDISNLSEFISYKNNTSCIEVTYKKDGIEERIETSYLINTSIRSDLTYAKGVNVVIESQLEAKYGLAFNAKRSGMFFSVPRNKNSVIGTWYFNNMDKDVLLSEKDTIEKSLKNILRKDYKIKSFDIGFIPVNSFNLKFPEFANKPFIKRKGNYIEYNAIKYTSFLVEGRKLINSL